MLPRMAQSVTRTAMARWSPAAVRGVSALAAAAPVSSPTVAVTAQSQQQQQQSTRSTTASSAFKVGSMLAALLGGGVGVALCAETVEQPRGGGVDYAAVRKAIEDMLEVEGYDDGSYGPILVRLAWHSAGTYDKNKRLYGSDGATMRFSPECNHGANAGLKIARDLLEPIKRRFPGITYADLYTLAGGVAIEAMGGPHIEWRAGRSDAKDERSCPPDGSLPDASKGPSHIRDIFYRMGFSDREIVALCGAHAFGRCHTDRSGYKGPWTRAPTTFSNEYFRLLLEEEWTPKQWNGPLQYENSKTGSDLMMLPADLALRDDARMRRYVEWYANDEASFSRDFARAFQKLMELGVNFDKKAQINLKP